MNIVIIGATSAIAKASARIYAERNESLFLIARNESRLVELCSDLKVRGAKSVGTAMLDINKFNEHEKALDSAAEFLGSIDIALICHGSLPNQQQVEINFKSAQKEINTNGVSVISLLTILSEKFITQGHGTIAVITSVAGDRGRQPNYVYGAAKSMVSTYLQGLRGRLFPHKVNIVDIRPGLVDSPMTAGMKKGALWSSPEKVASKIVKGIDNGKHTIYAPAYWRLIMIIVCAFPEFIFKRLKF
ncbi:MAG: short-chain dehydrogenase [SAR86 cluster bacterium]|uniref:Short-chain dehydrogenase n=1 Tax=SAR86 cluster bacterium TaxID=2030880 RepID=A0A2A5AXS0_9GAMM|nr:MAG: short-chain dehydrogenase [SAR86 cluster bacterium]